MNPSSDTARRLRRTLHIVNAVLLAGLVGGSAWVYGQLPAEIPMHFGIGGTANRFAPTSVWAWGLLPLIATALAAMMYGLAGWLRHRPSAFNMPNDTYYNLPRRKQQQIVSAILQPWCYAVAALLLGLFAAGQYGSYVVATTPADQLPLVTQGVLYGAIGLILLSSIGLVVPLSRAVDRLEEDGSAA